MATPSGRFEVNKKICLSISSFHPETWQPSWGIRTALLALMAFFATEVSVLEVLRVLLFWRLGGFVFEGGRS
jgi:ubiquitin-protein ligase